MPLKIIKTLILLVVSFLKAVFLVQKREPNRLILYTRYPKAGTTKKRLISSIGSEGAAQLQKELTEHAISTARAMRAHAAIDFQVHYKGGTMEQMQTWLGSDLDYVEQCDGDLGEKMLNSIFLSFQQGLRKVVIFGADIPAIEPKHLLAAFDALSSNDVVIGPAEDGGYYLIGVRINTSKPSRHDRWCALFKNISWGSDKVFQETIAIAKEQKLKYHTLDTLYDIDRPEDIRRWYEIKQLNEAFLQATKISVIIPTLNEEQTIARVITYK